MTITKQNKDAPPRDSIGGTKAAAILGRSKWTTPFGAWKDLCDALDGKLEEREATEPMLRGLLSEDPLIEYASQSFSDDTGLKVESLGGDGILRHPEHGFIHGTPDRILFNSEGAPVGILEFKTYDSRNGDFDWRRSDYQTQLNHYAHLLEIQPWFKTKYPDGKLTQNYLMVATANYFRWKDVVSFIVRGYDPEPLFENVNVEWNLIGGLDEYVSQDLPQLTDFWEAFVVPREAPPLDGSEQAKNYIDQIAGERNGTLVLTEVESKTVEELVGKETRLKEQVKWIDAELSTIKNQIRNSLGSNERIVAGSVTIRASKRSGRSSFDDKALAKQHPDIHSQFVRPGKPFTVVTKSKTKETSK